MSVVQLTKGYVATIDEVDAEWAEAFSWHANICSAKVYATSNKRERMHRLIAARAGLVIAEHGPSAIERTPCSECREFWLTEQLIPCPAFGPEFFLCVGCVQRAWERQEEPDRA